MSPSVSLRMVVAVSILTILPACSKKAAGPGGRGPGGFAMPVEVATAKTQEVTDRFEAVGSVEADDAITITPEIDGIVTSIPFPEGEAVEEGAVIAQLQDDQLRAEFDRASALRAQREATFHRVQSVVDQGAGTPQDLDDARAALAVAKADLALAQARLEKSTIRAPFAGITGAREVSRGSYVRPGDAITQLANVSQVRVVFSAPERYLGKLRRGAKVRITTSAWPDFALEGTLDVIEPMLDKTTRSVRVVARATNLENRLRPGMSANVVATLAQRDNALTIPSESVFFDRDQSFVYLVHDDSTVTKTPLDLGTRMKEAVEVLSGLNEGDEVVRAGHQKLYEGAKVMPVHQGDDGQAKKGTGR